MTFMKTGPAPTPGEESANKPAPPQAKRSKGLRASVGVGGVSVAADRQNEEQILLAVMVQPEKMLRPIRTVPPSEFLIDEHQAIWTIFREQANRGILGDFTDLARAARACTEPFAGPLRKLVTALHESARSLSWEDCRVEERVANLATDAIRRRALEGPIADILRSIGSPTASLSDLATHARRLERSLRGGSFGKCIVPASVAHRQYMDSIRTGMARTTKVYGLGLPGFDAQLGDGFAPGKTSVLTGGTGEGKSTVALNWTRFLADQGRVVAYCAWEEGFKANLDKIVAAHLGIQYIDIVRRSLTHEQSVLIDETAHHYLTGGEGGRPLIRFVKNPFPEIWMVKGRTRRGVTNQDNIEAVEGILADAGADVIIYDMWERLTAEGSIHSVGQALEFTQALHTEYQVHGILIGQTNMDKIQNAGAAKNASSIKGTKKMPEIADQVFILDRPGLSSGRPDPEGDTIRVMCHKQRVPGDTLPVWEVVWRWQGDIQRISDPRLVSAASHGPGQLGAAPGDSAGAPAGVSDGEMW